MAKTNAVAIAVESKFDALLRQIQNAQLRTAFRLIEYPAELDDGAGVECRGVTEEEQGRITAALVCIKSYAKKKFISTQTRAAMIAWLLEAFEQGRTELIPIMAALLKSNKTTAEQSKKASICLFECDDAHMRLACELTFYYLCQNPLRADVIYSLKVAESHNPDALLEFLLEKFRANPQKSKDLLKNLAQTSTLIGNRILIELFVHKKISAIRRKLNEIEDNNAKITVIRALLLSLFSELDTNSQAAQEHTTTSLVSQLYGLLGFSSFDAFEQGKLLRNILPFKILRGEQQLVRDWVAPVNIYFLKQALLRQIDKAFPESGDEYFSDIKTKLDCAYTRLTHAQSILARKKDRLLIGTSITSFTLLGTFFIVSGVALLKFRPSISIIYGIGLIAFGLATFMTGAFFTHYVSRVKNEQILSLPNDTIFTDFYTELLSKTRQFKKTQSTSSIKLANGPQWHRHTTPNLPRLPIESPVRDESALVMPLRTPRIRHKNDYKPNRPLPLGIT